MSALKRAFFFNVVFFLVLFFYFSGCDFLAAVDCNVLRELSRK